MNEKITRQHEETDIYEIVGKVCEKLISVPEEGEDTVILLYILIDHIWLRIFLDDGLIFVDESAGPDPDDDLDEGETYVNLHEKYDCVGKIITMANMKGGVFSLGFSSGLTIKLEQIAGQTNLSVSL